jgi:hypothetical protein
MGPGMALGDGSRGDVCVEVADESWSAAVVLKRSDADAQQSCTRSWQVVVDKKLFFSPLCKPKGQD